MLSHIKSTSLLRPSKMLFAKNGLVMMSLIGFEVKEE